MITKFSVKIALLLLMLFIMPGLYSGQGEFSIRDYFALKKSGRYSDAFRVLSGHGAGLEEEAEFELCLLRLNELLSLFDYGDDEARAIEKLKSAPAAMKYPFLYARLMMITNRLLLSEGRISESEKILSDLGFMNFQITGPFSSSSEEEFAVENPPDRNYDPRGSYSGKKYTVKWFTAPSDREGTVNVNNFMDETVDSLYYLYSEAAVSRGGEYNLSLGKTGMTEVKVNGTVVFRNTEKHFFARDQYIIKMKLMPGIQRIMVKCGDSSDGIRLSMRLTDSNGVPVTVKEVKGLSREVGPPEEVTSGYFYTLNNYLSKKNLSSKESFNAGYFLFSAGLAGENNSLLLKYFSATAGDSGLSSSANWYAALSESDPEAREEFLKRVLSDDPVNIEAAAERARLKIKNGFFHQAFSLIRKIKDTDPLSPLYPALMLDFLYERGWHYEAEKWVEILKLSGSRSAAGIYSASIMTGRKEYSAAASVINSVYGRSLYNFAAFESLVSLYENAGDLKGALDLLYSGTIIFPDRVSVRLGITRITRNLYGPSASLPSLAAAAKLSPYHREVLTVHALAYDAMGRQDLATEYFRLVSLYDPDNFSVKRYLEIYASDSDFNDKYSYTGDVSILNEAADAYKTEPVIVLLEQKIVSVNPDGSFSRSVRNAVRINDRDAASNFRNQYIVYDPEVETVENIKCVTVNSGVPDEITEKYSRSLSDPESRLYYNLQAVVVPVKTINSGTIIDFSYTVKNRGGSVYKNYFGEKFSVGSKYRTIKTNIVLIHPEAMKIFSHIRGMDSSAVKSRIKDSSVIYSLKIDNISPYRDEPAMPHYSVELPALYFSTLRNWNEFYVYYRSLLDNRVKMTPEMIKDLSGIIDNNDSQEVKVAKIHEHITGSIRYVGFEFGLGGIQPRSTDRTYQSKMGDCKDVSLLLAAFLRYAGIDASLALVRTKDKGAVELALPFIGEFNHAICYVKLDSGSEFFLDATSRSSGYRELPTDNRNISALVIDERVSDKKGGPALWKFVNTDTGFYDREFEEVSTDVIIQPDGSAEMNRILVKHGTSAAAVRESLKDIDSQNRSVTEYWNRLFPGSLVSEMKILSSDKNSPSSYSYHIKVKSFAVIDNYGIVFNPFFNRSDYYNDYAVIKERRFPLIFSGKSSTLVKMTYYLPEGYTVTIPDNEIFNGNKVSASFQYRLNRNILEVLSEIKFLDYSIQPSEYKEFRKFAAFVHRKESEKVVLLKK